MKFNLLFLYNEGNDTRRGFSVKQLTYQDALAFIHGRTKFKKIPTLDRMRDFCKRLGDPQRNLKMIHVTGTNGKGSTTAYIRQLLIENGFKVGSFTSPFIIKFNDRICINGEMIPDDDLVQMVSEIQPIVAQMDDDWADRGGGPTEFEIDTAIMFKYFTEQQVDYAVIEVGLGGTYDSTNVIQPLVSVITGVAKDHLKYLGPTLQDVARNKAGIIKQDTPVVVADLPDDLFAVITEKAQRMNAPVYKVNDQIKTTLLPNNVWGENFNYDFGENHLKNLHLEMIGDYQVSNAALAITAVELLAESEHWNLQDAYVKRALAQTRWPGRFERVNESPLIVLDGAHNIQAIKKIAKLLKDRFHDRQIHIITSILADKQPKEMLTELLKLANVEITVTRFNSPRPVIDPQKVKEEFPQVSAAAQWQQALVDTVQTMDEDDVLLFTGSLYFISEVRHYFVNDEENENEN